MFISEHLVQQQLLALEKLGSTHRSLSSFTNTMYHVKQKQKLNIHKFICVYNFWTPCVSFEGTYKIFPKSGILLVHSWETDVTYNLVNSVIEASAATIFQSIYVYKLNVYSHGQQYLVHIWYNRLKEIHSLRKIAIANGGYSQLLYNYFDNWRVSELCLWTVSKYLVIGFFIPKNRQLLPHCK